MQTYKILHYIINRPIGWVTLTNCKASPQYILQQSANKK